MAEKQIRLKAPRTEVVTTLRHAGKRLDEAIRLKRAGYSLLAHDELATLFDEEAMLPRPDQNRVAAEESRRIRKGRRSTGAVPGTGAGAQRPRVQVNS